MEIKDLLRRITDFLKKYRYAAIVLVIGIALMVLPVPSGDSWENVEEKKTVPTELSISMEDRLEKILSQIDGAGRVEVMLTIAFGEEKLYQYDEDTSVSDTANSIRKTVVTVTDSQRNETGLIRQTNPPVYMGAVIIYQGAENPTIKLAIVDAVSKATGLGANEISVLKMK